MVSIIQEHTSYLGSWTNGQAGVTNQLGTALWQKSHTITETQALGCLQVARGGNNISEVILTTNTETNNILAMTAVMQEQKKD